LLNNRVRLVEICGTLSAQPDEMECESFVLYVLNLSMREAAVRYSHAATTVQNRR